MTAATGAAGRHRVRVSRDPALPDHLVVWPTGGVRRGVSVDGRPDDGASPDDADACEVIDHRISSPFSFAELVSEIRSDDPEAVVAAVYPSTTSTSVEDDWIELARVAAGDDEDSTRRVFTGDTTPTSLRALRRWVSTHATAAPQALDDLILATSELATNVERHARGWLTVDLAEVGDRLVVAVTDPAVDRFPEPRSVAADQVSGRGLLVVAAVSELWGVVARPTSKTVWAALSR